MGLLRGWQRSFAVLPLLVLGLAADAGCYSTGDGTAPPGNSFYFPVGLAVSHGGNVLYAVNSDFDLQYNGGTLQSYDLRLIRQHTLWAIKDPTDKRLPLVRNPTPGCTSGNPPVFRQGADGRQPLGETCAPPVKSDVYFRDSGVIGAFATDLLLSVPPAEMQASSPKAHADDPVVAADDTTTDRLFAPVRGNTTVTWADVVRDDPNTPPGDNDTAASYKPFKIDCGQDNANRCNAPHQIGADANEVGNTRHLTMPGEPFGATISDDGTSLLVTHQDDTNTTLFSTGLSRTRPCANQKTPCDKSAPGVVGIRFVADNVPVGGIGIAPIPHDPDAFLGASALPLPAFLETSRAVAQVSLIRRYNDDYAGGPDNPRPFLNVETAFPITASAGGTDSRGIAIDPTPRLSCKARVPAVGQNGMTVAERDKQIQACARKPARVFIANRSPASLLVGEVGTTQGIDANYDPDRLTIHTSVPLAAGPSRVYLAPIVDRDGAYALRVFVVCFDSASIYVYDPDAAALENVIRVGPGPFAMAFDPFSLSDVATHAQVPTDPNLKDSAQNDAATRRYRFAYIASFTQSFVQIIDLDDAVPNPVTFERIVYTLGLPTNPKGT